MGFLYSQLWFKPAYPTTSCTGQTIIVTGSNVGLGKEAARHFARLGASKVILAVRNVSAGEAAAKDIAATTRCAPSVLEVWPLDLSSNNSVASFASRASSLPRIDVLLENAGVATHTFKLAPDGHEQTIAVNVVGTFYLALLLLPKLKSTARDFSVKPRLTVVSSGVHAWPKFPERDAPGVFAALSDPATPTMRERYPTSKLLEVLVVRQLAPALAGTGVVLNVINPGLCHSELARDAPWSLHVYKFFLARSTEVGSRTLVASALAGEESHGMYMHDCVVDEGEVSEFVRSAEGRAAGEKVWRELREILEGARPGVAAGL